MAKGDKFYFDNFVETTKISKEAAEYLVTCLEHYNPDDIEDMLKNMHDIENRADVKKHEMSEALVKAFVTPVDREDLAMLSHNLDQVTDRIEEVLQKFYIYNIQTVEPSSLEFARKLVHSCELLCELMAEFENFKRSKKIKSLIIALNDVEEECDQMFLHSMRAISKNPADAYTAISLCKIYDCFEACADACEHASECVETVIMKNT